MHWERDFRRSAREYAALASSAGSYSSIATRDDFFNRALSWFVHRGMKHPRSLMVCACTVFLGQLGCSETRDDANLESQDAKENAPSHNVVSPRNGAALAADCEQDASAGLALEPHDINLWPPNHKFHSIAVEDCVTVIDSCDQGGLRAEFVWASSDEPVDATGDGHHAPDIQLGEDCQEVQVRSERQGPSDGRVYTLAVRVVDRAGHVSEAECHVIVDHDQRGVLGSDSGEAYRVRFDVGDLACDGTPPPPTTETPTTPPPAPDDEAPVKPQ
jgi:hypothetical protein